MGTLRCPARTAGGRLRPTAVRVNETVAERRFCSPRRQAERLRSLGALHQHLRQPPPPAAAPHAGEAPVVTCSAVRLAPDPDYAFDKQLVLSLLNGGQRLDAQTDAAKQASRVEDRLPAAPNRPGLRPFHIDDCGDLRTVSAFARVATADRGQPGRQLRVPVRPGRVGQFEDVVERPVLVVGPRRA